MIAVPRHEWGNQAQWAVTAPLLAASLAGVSGALGAALGLCAVSTLYYGMTLQSLRPYRVQVRLGFMTVAGLALLPELHRVLWIPLVGTTAQVLVGYCPMARLLDLMPWNREGQLTWRAVIDVVTRPPGPEGLLTTMAIPRSLEPGSVAGTERPEQRIVR